MALSKETVVSEVTVMEGGEVFVTKTMYVVEDGKRITDPKYSRYSYNPGDKIPANEDARVGGIAKLVWTPEVISTFKEKADAVALKMATQFPKS